MKSKKHASATAKKSEPLYACTTPVNTGLTQEEIELRVRSGLVNTAVESSTRTEKQIVRDNCLTFFNLIFLVLAALLILVGSFRDMLFLIIVAANTGIGIFQEIRSKRTIDKLTLMTARTVPVIRSGKQQKIPSEKLVRDDIVVFAAGDQICADAVVRAGTVQVNESLLTGEQDAIAKRVGDVLLSGSFVISGRCRAQLTCVGADSYAARLTAEAKDGKNVSDSEMMASLDRVIRFIGITMIPLGILLFLKEYFVLHLDLQASVQATVAALVGMIPEGLYLLTSVALAVSVLRLARSKVLTQDMACIENLARVDVLCVDKTGTITDSVMEPADPVILPGAEMTLQEIQTILSEIYGAQEPDNDTGRAMANRFYTGTTRWKTEKYIPFSSATKWTGAVFSGHGGYLIGAPEFIMGPRLPQIAREVSGWLGRGYRVLLLAAYDGIPVPQKLEFNRLRPLALIPLTNRIRPEAPATFQYFASQGVSVKVISGDNPLTVSEVARQACIADSDLYIDATTLKDDAAIAEAAEHYAIFGRVTPDQKRKLVRAMQAAGHTVAMTGDGVNDVLALKDADCGIAMASGAEAAAQVAQLVLLDSDFSRMPEIVDEGRRVINNIQRAASLFFVKNIFSFMLTIVSLFIDMPYPLLPLHLSIISGLTIGVPAFFLALEPNHERVKGRFITNVFLRAMPGGLTDVALVLLVEAFVAIFNFPDDQLYTMSAIVMSVIGLRVLYQVSRPLNWKRAAVITAMTAGLTICYSLFGGFFGYTMPTIRSGLVCTVLVLLSFQIMRTNLQLFALGEKGAQKLRIFHQERKMKKLRKRLARAGKKQLHLPGKTLQDVIATPKLTAPEETVTPEISEEPAPIPQAEATEAPADADALDTPEEPDAEESAEAATDSAEADIMEELIPSDSFAMDDSDEPKAENTGDFEATVQTINLQEAENSAPFQDA